ncbi:hypothetical protein [Novosphingobium pentaromativorans]|uniref:Uncharacterized protein n=1 Tax=Novosphingobium pentaromativorans US6-1 TaxID=1088721 RepID=G6E8R2_9SPHN|nr:hypothetical protein [Novosphingobium pentaromativorans]AIT81255.1 hypothetical protein JI59_16450 [Novosphingobium pentaromativorans US6-1]EHJ62136.1 hypothetical protein NSU_0733 [Novosphingobium pentaromativorans US6-1]
MSNWLPGTKNDCGVYCPHEELKLYRKGGGRRAAIDLVETPEGWRSYRGFSFFTGSWWGSTGPITDDCQPHPRREDAIREQIARFHRDFAKLTDPSMQREAREIIEWAESLVPDQMDLFGAAA